MNVSFGIREVKPVRGAFDRDAGEAIRFAVLTLQRCGQRDVRSGLDKRIEHIRVVGSDRNAGVADVPQLTAF